MLGTVSQASTSMRTIISNGTMQRGSVDGLVSSTTLLLSSCIDSMLIDFPLKVCPWSHGIPQLFWINRFQIVKVPEFCERTDVMVEYI